MTISDARAEFDRCWARFVEPATHEAEPVAADAVALERSVMGWLGVALTASPDGSGLAAVGALGVALRETAEAREIVRRAKGG